MTALPVQMNFMVIHDTVPPQTASAAGYILYPRYTLTQKEEDGTSLFISFYIQWLRVGCEKNPPKQRMVNPRVFIEILLLE